MEQYNACLCPDQGLDGDVVDADADVDDDDDGVDDADANDDADAHARC